MSRRNNDIRRRAKTQSEASPNLFSRFFKKIAGGSVTYLMACLVETNFAEIRKGALKAINKSYLDRHGGIPIDDVMDMLGFDDVEECIENCQEYDLEISYGNRPSVVVNRRLENKQRVFKGTMSQSRASPAQGYLSFQSLTNFSRHNYRGNDGSQATTKHEDCRGQARKLLCSANYLR